MKNILFSVLACTLIVSNSFQMRTSDIDLEKLGEGKGHGATFAFRKNLGEDITFGKMPSAEKRAMLAKKAELSFCSVSDTRARESNNTQANIEQVSPVTVTSCSPVPNDYASPRLRLCPRVWGKHYIPKARFKKCLEQSDDEESDEETSDVFSGQDIWDAIDNKKYNKAVRIIHNLSSYNKITPEVIKQTKNVLQNLSAQHDNDYEFCNIAIALHHAYILNLPRVKELKNKLANPDISKKKRLQYEFEIEDFYNKKMLSVIKK